MLQLNPEYAEAYVNRGWSYHQLGIEHPALKDLTVALHYFNEQLIIYYSLILRVSIFQNAPPKAEYCTP